jgi:hypothetical protein
MLNLLRDLACMHHLMSMPLLEDSIFENTYTLTVCNGQYRTGQDRTGHTHVLLRRITVPHAYDHANTNIHKHGSVTQLQGAYNRPPHMTCDMPHTFELPPVPVFVFIILCHRFTNFLLLLL